MAPTLRPEIEASAIMRELCAKSLGVKHVHNVLQGCTDCEMAADSLNPNRRIPGEHHVPRNVDISEVGAFPGRIQRSVLENVFSYVTVEPDNLFPA